MAVPKTKQQQAEAGGKIIQQRILNAPTSQLSWDEVLLALHSSADQPPLGTCRYIVDGQPFTVGNITQAECTRLGGDFS